MFFRPFCRLLVGACAVFQLLVGFAVADSVPGFTVKIQFNALVNSGSSNCDASCCDVPGSCISECDYIFHYGFDYITGNDEPTNIPIQSVYTHPPLDDQNNVTFSFIIVNQPNPIVYSNGGRWEGIKYKMWVEDYDASSANDYVDGYVLTIPANTVPGSNGCSTTSIATTVNGQCTARTSSIELSYAVNCYVNYYGSDCTVYCEAQDGDTGHYVCDPATGDKVCRAGWTDPNANCLIPAPTVGPVPPPTTPSKKKRRCYRVVRIIGGRKKRRRVLLRKGKRCITRRRT